MRRKKERSKIVNPEEMRRSCKGRVNKCQWGRKAERTTRKENMTGKLAWKGPKGTEVQQNVPKSAVINSWQ